MALVLISFVPVTWGLTTGDCKIDVTKLQRCPKKNLRLVPKNFQPQILFLDQVRLASDVEFLEALPEGTMVAVTGVAKKSLKESLVEKYPAEKVAEIEKKLLYYPHHTYEAAQAARVAPEVDNEGGGYIRDLAVLGFDPTTGKIQYNFQKKSWHPESDELEICGVKTQMNDLGHQFFNPGYNRGGNVMVMPGGQCLVGESMSHEKALTLCGQGEGVEIVKIPTLGTTVGHIDELVNIIPSNRPAPCNFNIVIADQETHDKILKENPDDRFFQDRYFITNKDTLEEFYFDPNHCQRNGCPARLPQVRVCEFYRAYKTLLYFQNKLTRDMYQGAPRKGKSRSQDKASLLLDFFISPAFAGAARIGSETPEDLEAKKREGEAKERAIKNYGLEYTDEVKDELKRSMKKCSELTNKDVLEVMSASNYSQIKEFIENQEQSSENDQVPIHRLLRNALYNIEGNQKANTKITESLEKTRSILAQNIPAECREKAFIKVPYLFIDAKAVNPNPANVLAAGKVVITPEQINPAVGKFIERQYQELGFKPFTVNTFSKHTGGGNVHCLTNELRLCAPAH